MSKFTVLIVDDNIGAISWLIEFLEWRGYNVDVVSNEEAARTKLEAVQEGKQAYELAIVDIMVSIKDIMDVPDFDDEFYEASMDTGLRLCRYAREGLGILEEQLPIVCISARYDDEDLRKNLEHIGISIYSRSGGEIREFLKKSLPKLT